jgi:regulator of sigma D
MSIDEAQAEIDRCNKEEQNCSDIPDEFEPRFSSAFSDPCFEYWLLLHFVETAGHFETCKKVIKELKKYLRYTKRTFDINKVLPETNKAAARARKLRKSGVTNPSTTLDLLVASLKKLRD